MFIEQTNHCFNFQLKCKQAIWKEDAVKGEQQTSERLEIKQASGARSKHFDAYSASAPAATAWAVELTVSQVQREIRQADELQRQKDIRQL